MQDGDEVVSLNGEPCVDLTLLQALELLDASIGCVQLLLKRWFSLPHFLIPRNDGCQQKIVNCPCPAPTRTCDMQTMHDVIRSTALAFRSHVLYKTCALSYSSMNCWS